MTVHKGNVIYFESPGFQNTDSVIDVTKERLRMKDVVAVIVPMTTGRTLEKFLNKLGKETKIISISEDEVMKACKRISYPDKGTLGKLVRNRLGESSENNVNLRRDIFDITFLPLCGDSWKLIAETLYVFGQGMKVAIEIAVAAVEIGKIGSSTKVISVGGTGEGADTAVVLRTSTQKKSFAGKHEERLSIQEILAMPIDKW
ncbi:hypothetical protein [[Eubacterium] cellulosolvens]